MSGAAPTMTVHVLVNHESQGKERDELSSPLEEILKRLEAIEMRLSQLESAQGRLPPAPEASNAAAFRGGPPVPVNEAAARGSDQAPRDTSPAQAPSAGPESPAPAPRVAVGNEPKSYSSTAVAPSTERLHPLSHGRAPADPPLPDLSLLDEKVDPRKGPAQVVEVQAAIEDYPRICARIQQLWGSPECEGYINNLVIDTRGNRKGFPPAVMEELLYLGRLARALVILSVNGDLWDTFDQVGDRR